MKRPIALAAVLLVAFAAVIGSAYAATDPYRSRQWALDRIQADKAWTVSKGAGIQIAIVDSGIDLDHPDLKNKIASAVTCIGGACKAGGADDNGHGSHVAGIAGAATGNGTGIAGVAPSAKLMAVKVLDADGGGDCEDVERGIRWSADHGADVVNLSLGPEVGLIDTLLGGDCVTAVQGAAQYAWNMGAVVVVAAGNDSLRSVYDSSAVIVVGATGPEDEPAYYSSSGADIYAPGGDAIVTCSAARCIFSTWVNGYRLETGTSMAAPHISGVAALLLARGYSKTQVLSRIRSTADEIGDIRRVNAARAVGSVAGTKTTKPGSSPSTGGRGGSARTPSQSLSPTSATTRSPSVNSLTPLPLPSSSAVLGLRDGATMPPSGPPSRTVVISVAGGFALLVGAAYAGRLLRAGG